MSPGTYSSAPQQVRSGSRSASSAGIALACALFGLLITSALYFARDNLMFFTAVFCAGGVLVLTAALLSRWYQKYGRRRSKRGELARGQTLAVLAFGAWCLQLVLMAVRMFLSVSRWQGF